MTATDSFQSVKTIAEAIKNDALDVIETMSFGDDVRQGDIYIVCFDERPQRASDYQGRQLAPGNSQGSRHCVSDHCLLYTPDRDDSLRVLHRLVPETKKHEQFLGPVVESDKPWTLEHPEHGDRVFPAGVYQVTYQRSWANEIRRQMD